MDILTALPSLTLLLLLILRPCGQPPHHTESEEKTRRFLLLEGAGRTVTRTLLPRGRPGLVLRPGFLAWQVVSLRDSIFLITALVTLTGCCVSQVELGLSDLNLVRPVKNDIF